MAGSFAHITAQLTDAQWTYSSAWELDYLEACCLHTPLAAERFPSPAAAVIPAHQTFHPAEPSEQARARCCPYPSLAGAWQAREWKTWLAGLQPGHIVVPAVSWQVSVPPVPTAELC